LIANAQIIGSPERGAACFTRGWSDARRGSSLMLDNDGKPAGAITVNVPADLRIVRKAIETGAPIDPAKWANIAIPAKDCLTGHWDARVAQAHRRTQPGLR
jgi:hypothetical protein